LLASDRGLRDSPIAAGACLAALTALTFAVHWTHLVRFDREARPFERVIAKLPDAPKLYFLCWDREGSVVRTHPYHHFHAYVQARRGGIISFSFPEMFWNIPVRLRSAAGVPAADKRAEWRPRFYDYDDSGYFYDHVLVRTQPGAAGGVETLAKFPYELVYSDPPWELYRRDAGAAGWNPSARAVPYELALPEDPAGPIRRTELRSEDADARFIEARFGVAQFGVAQFGVGLEGVRTR
jgi:hypothetical protein